MLSRRGRLAPSPAGAQKWYEWATRSGMTGSHAVGTPGVTFRVRECGPERRFVMTTNGQREAITVQEKRPRRLPAWPEDMERYFDRRMRDFAWPFRRFRRPIMEAWLPDIDVFEREGKIVVRADLPGMRAEDVEVSVEGDLITITGKREEEKEVKEENYYCSERAFGEFSRTVRLPEGSTAEEIEATCSEGVLEVMIPKPSAPEAKSVKVLVK